MPTRKPSNPKPAPKTAAPKPPPPVRKASSEKPSPPVSGEDLQRLVAEAAYYRAQRRGFEPGYELQDWVEAEAEVKRLIGRSP
jgi:Protein of unknown function (DUF2934)